MVKEVVTDGQAIPQWRIAQERARLVGCVRTPEAWAKRHLSAHHRREKGDELIEGAKELHAALAQFQQRCGKAYCLDIPLLASAIVRSLGHEYVLNSGFAEVLRDAAVTDREADKAAAAKFSVEKM